MKKIGLIIIMTCCLVFGLTFAASAQGLYFGLGYQEFSNDLTITLPDLDGTNVDLNTPCKMYTADLGYEFNNHFSVETNYSWGETDLAGIQLNAYEATVLNADLTEDNTIFKIEGKGKFAVSEKFSIAGIIGYAEYKTTTTGTLNLLEETPQYSAENMTGIQDASQGVSENSADIIQKLNGTYVGVEVSYSPTVKLELGASYRWMINPSGNLKVNINSYNGYDCDLEDMNHSIIDVYAKTNLTDHWTAAAGYTKTLTEYSIPGVDIACDTSGLWVKCQYKF